jgi:hypothetical protein
VDHALNQSPRESLTVEMDIRRSGNRGVSLGNGKSRNAISSYSSALSCLSPLISLEIGGKFGNGDVHAVGSSVNPRTSEKAPHPPVDRYTSSPCPFPLHLELQSSYNISLHPSSTYSQLTLLVSLYQRREHTRLHQHPVYSQIF